MTSAGRGELVLQGRSRFRLLPFLGPAFIAAVARLAGDPALRESMGRAARARFLERHTMTARARQVLG